MVDHRRQVRLPLARQHIDPVQPHIRALRPVGQLRLEPLQPRARRQDGLAIDAARLDQHLRLGDRDRIRRLVGQHDPGHFGTACHVQFKPVVRHPGRTLAFMALQQQQLRTGPHRDARGHGVARPLGTGDQAQAHRLVAGDRQGGLAHGPAVDEHHGLAAQRLERPTTGQRHRRRRRRRGGVAQVFPEVAVFPGLDPARGEAGGVLQVDERQGVHAASIAYLS